MAIQWGLAQGPNSFQNALGMGLQLGSMVRERKEQQAAQEAETQGRNALAGFAMGDQSQMGAAMQYDPRATLGIRQDMATAAKAEREQQAQAAEQRRADLPTAIRLLEGATDEASYQRNMQTAAQYGIDTSGFPQQFDPQWRDENLTTMKMLGSPKGQEILSTAGKVAADMGYQPGTPEFSQYVRDYTTAQLAKPYTGSQGETRLYTPQIGGAAQSAGPEVGAVVGGYRFKGGNPNDRSSWEQAGGGASNGAGSFQAGQ